MKEITATIIKNEPIAAGVVRLDLETEETIPVRAGQFLNLSTGDGAHLLRRPVAVCIAEGNRFTVCFQIKGEGTKLIARKKAGETVSVLLPLGNGFPCEGEERTVALVGGGVGVFPMIACLRDLKKAGKTVRAYMGFRSADAVCMEEELQRADFLSIVTDDGSYGKKGNAVEAFLADLKNGRPDVVFACGPVPMLRALKAACQREGLTCFVSLEERMGCGIGACLVCVCGKSDGKRARVCKDGPVFNAEDVAL